METPLIYNITPLHVDDEYIIRQYDGIEIKSNFPVFEVVNKTGKLLGLLIWTEKEQEPPFDRIVAYG